MSFSSTCFLSSSARCFWTCVQYKKKKKKIQEGGEEKKDHSEGIWLVLIWKYCFTSSEPNYWSELVVLSEPAHSHRSPDGQGVVHKSVTVTMVCTWTPGSSTALLLCSRSEALLCYRWTRFYTHRQCLKRHQTFFIPSSSAAFVLLVCMCYEKWEGSKREQRMCKKKYESSMWRMNINCSNSKSVGIKVLIAGGHEF